MSSNWAHCNYPGYKLPSVMDEEGGSSGYLVRCSKCPLGHLHHRCLMDCTEAAVRAVLGLEANEGASICYTSAGGGPGEVTVASALRGTRARLWAGAARGARGP